MAGTTTKMGITYPTSGDYVVNGASAMQTIATDVDNKSGLVFIKSQAVGAGVTTVTVNTAFSTNFDNYKIVYMGGSSSGFTDLWLRLGATATGYYMGGSYTAYSAGAVTAVSTGLVAQWSYAGVADPSGNALSVEVYQPYLADQSGIAAQFFSLGSTRVGGAAYGVLNNTTSYTAFTILVSAGTITGGTIRVYGYNQ